MRLIWLVNQLWPDFLGGAEHRAEYISSSMRQQGHEVTLMVAHKPTGFSETLPDGRKVVGLGHTPPLQSAWRVRALWRIGQTFLHPVNTPNADAVFCPDSFLGLGFLIQGTGIPLIYCPGGVASSYLRWEFGQQKSCGSGNSMDLLLWQYVLFERLCLYRSARVIALSEMVLRQMRQGHPGTHRIDVVISGHQPDLFPGEPRSDTNRPFTVLCVARLHRIKNVEFLIRAWGKMRHAPRRLLLAGDGEERPGLESLANELGIDDQVVFLGHRQDVPDLLGQADAFVLPSAYEACPLAFLEAMGAGLPCLCLQSIPGLTEVAASEEMNVHGETGFNVDPRDPADLAHRLDWLADHPEQRVAMGLAARRRAREKFTWDRTADGYLQIARELSKPLVCGPVMRGA